MLYFAHCADGCSQKEKDRGKVTIYLFSSLYDQGYFILIVAIVKFFISWFHLSDIILGSCQDPDDPGGSNSSKAFLLQMNFSPNEVEFAIEKLGM